VRAVIGAGAIFLVGAVEVWLVGATGAFGQADDTLVVQVCAGTATFSAGACLIIGALLSRKRPAAADGPGDDGRDLPPAPPEPLSPADPPWWPGFERDFREYAAPRRAPAGIAPRERVGV
jgi:hypothetical protein